MIKTLLQFELYSILESLVTMDDSMIHILQKVNHPISDKILSMVDDKGQINTDEDMRDTSLIIVGDTPDSVIFQRQGRALNLNDKLKIGRLVKKIDKYTINNGKYGYYIIFNNKFYSIPKDYDVKTLTKEMCDVIIKIPKKVFKKG